MPRPLLCATVTATTMAELLERRDAVHGADLVELRLDGVRDVDAAGALAGPAAAGDRHLPRRLAGRAVRRRRGDAHRHPRTRLGSGRRVRRRRGRRRRGPGAARRRPAHRAVVPRLHRRGGRRGVAPGAAAGVGRRGREARRDRRRGWPICGALAELGRGAAGRSVVLAMGDAGVASRVLATQMGARWTYAGDAVAPGQLSLARMRDEFRVRRLGPAHPRVRRARPAGRPFAVAGDAQRGLRGARGRCRVPAAGGGELRGFRGVRRRVRRRGRLGDGAVQARRRARRPEPRMPAPPPSAPSTRCGGRPTAGTAATPTSTG